MSSKNKSSAGKPSGLAALAALRSQVPAGPAIRYWLVATSDGGAPCGWIPVTRYHQTISGMPDAALRLPEIYSVAATVIEADDGRVMLQIVGFSQTVASKDGGWIEDGTQPSVRVDGRAVRRVGSEVELRPETELTLRGLRKVCRLRLAAEPPSAPARAPDPGPPLGPDPRDIVLRGERRHVDGDLHAGWIELGDGGELVCTGQLACLGITVDAGATLRCRELVTNYLSVDNTGRGSTVEATAIRARVVHRVELALEAVIERGGLSADYQQHDAGDLNPSWDHNEGTMPLLPELYEPAGDDDEIGEIDELEIRARLRAGRNIFAIGDLLVR